MIQTRKQRGFSMVVDMPKQERVMAALNLPVAEIHLPEKQPRRWMDPQKLEQLTESVRHYGILEPLIVRPRAGEGYELVAGERRYRAAIAVGLSHVPVTVHELSDRQALEIALLENLQRDDLNSIDETESILELLCQVLDIPQKDVISLMNRAAMAIRTDRAKTTELTDNEIRQLAVMDNLFTTVGRLSREGFRVNRLPLLRLPADVLEFLRGGELEYTKARVIAKVEDSDVRRVLMEQVVAEQLSLSELKKRIAGLGTDVAGKAAARDMRAEFQGLVRVRSAVWQDKQKQEQLEKIMNDLKKLLAF
jgi:ParB family transcriptional regulator, chromosome partitioning protein